MARMLVVDVNDCKVYEKDCNGLQDYYDAIGCRVIDIARRRIGGRPFDIIVDDEGLLKQDIIVSAISSDHHRIMLVGNLVICNHDGEGNETDLTEQDVDHISGYIKNMMSNEGRIQPVLTHCEY